MNRLYDYLDALPAGIPLAKPRGTESAATKLSTSKAIRWHFAKRRSQLVHTDEE